MPVSDRRASIAALSATAPTSGPFPFFTWAKKPAWKRWASTTCPSAAVRDWLLAVTDFTVRQHAARLVYAHPFGAERFFPTLRAWLDNADALQAEGRFRWYTMTELAGFLKQRDSVQWTLLRTSDDKVTLHASHPNTLAHQTWIFPQADYGDARVVKGNATVRVQDGMILLAAGDGRQLSVEFTKRHNPRNLKVETVEAKR